MVRPRVAGVPRARRGTRHRFLDALPYWGLIAFAFAGTSYLLRLQQPGMILGLGGVLAGAYMTRRVPDWGGPIGLGVIAFIFAVQMSVPGSIWLGPSINEGIEFLKLLVVFMVAVNALKTEKRLWQFAAFIVIMMTLFPALGAAWNYHRGILDEPGRADWEGYYGNANHLAMTLLMHVPVAAALWGRERRSSYKALWLLVMVILLAVSVLTKSRAGFLSIGFLGLLVIVASRHKLRTVAIVSMAAAFGWFAAPQDFRDRMGTIFEPGSQRDESATSRTIIWKVAVEVGFSRPLTGVGVGTYEQANARNAPWSLGDSGGQRWLDTHNTYLNVWAETGGLGLVTFVAMLGFVFREGVRAIGMTPRGDPLRRLVKGALIGVGVFGAMGMFNTLHDAWFLYTMFAIVANGSRLLTQRYRVRRAPYPSSRPLPSGWQPQPWQVGAPAGAPVRGLTVGPERGRGGGGGSW